MDTVLLIIGVLGAGAVLISAYVFMVAARNYVSGADDHAEVNRSNSPQGKVFTDRNVHDRRVKKIFDFPMTVNGMLIPIERRTMVERRGIAV